MHPSERLLIMDRPAGMPADVLRGFRIGVTSDRRSADLIAALERRGAQLTQRHIQRFQRDGVIIELRGRQVSVNDRRISLGPNSLTLLVVLASSSGQRLFPMAPRADDAYPAASEITLVACR